ncbi:MAG TPA: right-handed parallel beta-helix repeat-containing protein, partial [Bacteroidia bacterium]|nr:right-handed parallel beta-helix repeat-containing protein [Bacteroidia bacterium]
MSKSYTTFQRIKQLKNLLAILFLIFSLCVGNLQAQVTVSPGVGGPYATVNAAFAAINAGTHTGAVTIAISANTTEPAAPTVLAASGVGAANYSSITIYPTAASVVVAGASTATNGVLVFNGADNITINGNLNNGSGTTRNLTIQNTPALVTTAHSVLWFQGTATAPALGCTNIVVKNTNIQGNGNLAGTSGTTTYSTGIVFVGTTAASSTTLGANHDNITISNNLIKRVTNGIHMGNAIATPITNLIIQDNEIGSAVAAEAVYYRGMWLSNISGAIIRRNHVFNIIPTLSTQTLDRMGIEITGTGSVNCLIERNQIHGLATYSTSGYGGYGININGGNNHTIVNNLVYDIQGYGWTTQANCPEGIRLSAGTGHKVYYNSVHLYGQLTGTTTRYSAAFVVAATTVTGIDVRNNIFSNQMTAPNSTTTENMVMWFAASYNFATAGNTINNNGLFLTPSSANHILGKVGTTAGTGNSTSIGAWQLASTGDANSVPLIASVAPFTSNTNLTIPTSTNTSLESGGIAIASLGLPNTDYIGTNRPAGTGTAPDIGAYEFEGVAAGCNSAPSNGGSASISAGTACLGGTVILSATGYTSDLGITYQWTQASAVGGPYTPVPGRTNPSGFTTDPLTVSTFYRLEVTCSNTSQTTVSNVVNVSVYDPQLTGTNSPQNLCGTGSLNFTASVSSAVSANWYTAASGGTPIHTGLSFTTPVISTTTNYWVAATSGGSTSNVSKLAPEVASTGTVLTTYGQDFTVTTAFVLNSIQVFSTTGTSITVALYSAGGTTQLMSTGPVAVTAGTSPTINLGWSIAPGTYRLCAPGMTGNFIRDNTGVTYPFSLTGIGTMNGFVSSITGSVTTSSSYYFLYNWSVTTGCESARTMVTANVTSAPTINPSSPLTLVCSGGSTTLNVSSTNDPNYTYTWNPGNLAGASVNVSPTTTTTYTVTALDNSAGLYAGCTTLNTLQIIAQPASATISGTPEGFCVTGGSATLSLNPSTGYPANSLQWQDSPNNSVFTDIVGATSASYITPTISATTYYKALIKNGNNVTCIEPTYELAVNNPIITGTTPASRCGTGTVQLGASVSGAVSANWYAAASGGAAIGSGTTFTTPIINATTTYYAAATAGGSTASTALATLPSGPSSGAGTTNFGLVFDVTAPFTLYSVVVYPVAASANTAGTVTIDVVNGSGTVLHTATVNVIGNPIASVTPQTVTLNFNIVPGTNYKLRPGSRSASITGLAFGPTASAPPGANYGYPFVVPGVLSITSSTLTATPTNTPRLDLYYYFFNWQISTGCESARQPVIATVTPAPAITVNASATAICPGGTADISVQSVNDPDYTYTWTSSPAGFTANGPGPHTVSPSITTKYYVNAVDNSAGPNQNCAMIDSITITNGGPLVAGTISAGQSDFCVSGSTTLTLTGASGGTKQWQVSTVSASGPWTNIGSGANTLATGTISQTSYYQVSLSCNASTVFSNVITLTVNNPQITGTTPGTRCGPGSVTIGATASQGVVNWFANASGGSSLATGNTYSPNVNSTTTYYASAITGAGGTSTVGAPNNGQTSGYTLEAGLFFNALSDFNLQGVYVYPVGTGAGTVDIAVMNASSVVILTTTVNLVGTAAPGIKTYVPLNWNITTGTGYSLVMLQRTGLVANLVRDPAANITGGGFPFTLPGVISITSGKCCPSATSTSYYYFYDWKIATGCEGVRVPVLATVTAPPAVTVSSTYPAVCNGGSTTLNVTSPNDPNYSYSWTSVPAGFTASTAGPHVVTPTVTTKYLLTATDNSAGINAGCVANDSITVVYSSGSPTAGTITASPTEICVSGTSTLTVTGASGGAIQWKESTVSASGPWTNVGTGATTYSTGTLTQTRYYQTETSCSGTTVSSATQTITVNNPSVISTTPGSRIATGSVQLGATVSAGATANWYTAVSGGTSIGSGSPFNTPVIASTTNYYVAASSGGGTAYTGKPSMELSATTGGGLTSYTIFDALSNFVLETVDVYPYGATDGAPGTVTVELRNSAGTSLMTQVVNVIAHSSTALSVPQTITLNFPITPGTGYRLGVASWTGGVTNMYRNDNGVYPYTVPGVISITGSSIASPPYVYFYYNWRVTTGCESARTMVTATVNPAPLDASIALVSPVNPANAGNNTVSVNITNNSSSDPITSLSLSYTDFTTTNTESFTGLNIPAGSTQLVTFVTPYFAANGFSFQASIQTVNGVVDYSQANDVTPTQNFCVSLNGTYTINSAAPTSGTNFNNLNDVAFALSCGVSGPVVFNLLSSYNAQVTIPPIVGASAVNTITFNGNGNVLTFAATVSSAPHTLALNGADYLRFNDLVIEGTGATYAMVCHLWNGADNNTFTNCTFNAPANGTSTTQVPFSISGSATSATATGVSGNNNIVTGCTMFSGYYNTTLIGASGTPNTGNQIINCNILDQNFYGIYNSYQNGAIIRGNNLSRPTRTTLNTYYGIYLTTGCTNMLVEKNRIHDTYAAGVATTGTTYNIYCTIDATAGNENKFFNNLISNINFAGTIYGMYMSGSDYWKAYHNTISLDQTTASGTTTTYGIYATGTVNYDVRNNIVYITRGGTGTKYCVYYSTPAAATSNTNDLFMNSSGGTNSIGYNGTAYATLSAWQAANPTFDQLSVSVDPSFSNPLGGNYSPNEPILNGIGSNLGIIDDIIGTARTINPDPGAFEFGIATAPPSCANVSVSNATCITATTLSWPFAAGYPSGYNIYLGTDGGGVTAPIGLLSGFNIGNLTSTVLPTLLPNTLYYYMVEPFNSMGVATGCTIGSFMSGANVIQTPTQSASSYTETMDNNVTPPALPCGMTSSNENFPADAFTWYTASGAANAHAGTRYLRIDKNTNNTTAKDDWFYSAPMNLTGGKLYRIYFWHRVGTAGSENFEVFLSNSNDAATMLTTSAVFNGTSNLLTYKLDSSADILPPFSGIYYYGIHANGAANGRSLYMDDIQVKQIPVAAMDPASCITVPSLYDQLLVQPVYQAQDYKFKIENLANSFSYEYTRNLPIPDFRLKWAPGVTYDLSYDVSVSYKKNNVWSPYGPPCVVTMGPFPTTQLRGASCGATLTD